VFLGRGHEERVIRDLVESAPLTGGALVVVGDPGVGKSALIDLARQTGIQHGLTVLTTTGIPAESRLPYAGLHQLLRPLREHIYALPGPQRDALLSAFGMRTGSAPDGFLVAMAASELVTAAAARQPLLVLADDAHWLDTASCSVVAFMARHIGGSPVALLATARDGYPLPLFDAGLPELPLAGLDDEAANLLLDAVAPELTAAARREILSTSVGNPLALRELSDSALGAGPRSQSALAGPGAVAVTYRIEKAFAARWSELPEQTQAVLVAGALNEGGAIAETLAAAGQILGRKVTIAALTPAIEARLIEVGQSRMLFRHPLVRSAIEYRAGLDQITTAHQALATILAGDPDRRTWHSAAATLGPDETVACELDEAAGRAEQRAATSIAVQAMERAVELSIDPVKRNGRLLRAAQLSWDLGQLGMVDRFTQSLDRASLDLHDRARLTLLQENLHIGHTESAEPIRYLVELARAVAADGQADFALDLLMAAARRGWWGKGSPDLETRLLVSDTAAELADSPLHPKLLLIMTFATPDIHGALVRDRLAHLVYETITDPVHLAYLGQAGALLGAFPQSRALLGAAISQFRTQGRLGLLVRALHYDAGSAIYTSQWDEAIAESEECLRMAAETGQQEWVTLVTAAMSAVAAMRGEDAEAERLATEAEQVFVTGSTAAAIGRGIAALGRRDYHEAYQHLMRIFDPADGAFHYLMRMYHLGDLADAASHSGHREQARQLIAGLTESSNQVPGPLLAVNLAFASAMLASDEEAGDVFEQVLTEDLHCWPFQYARLHLEYGGWLRRHRKSARSRTHLHAARDILQTIGARAWRDRADAELRASGERSPVAAPGVGRFGQLTAQEQQIARMVLAGLSNREIGERMNVSHRTVGYHLYRMFPKLGITSRAELGVVLAEAGVLTTG
jgi:DNA-binding CsgD family transcriptional regulator